MYEVLGCFNNQCSGRQPVVPIST